MTDKRSYGQFCGLAAALDVVGERWTLLIVRELLISPARFGELQANLPGAGPNLLSERLRELTTRGLLERTSVEGDARGTQYRLTEVGERLRGPLLDLARWGMLLLDEESANGTETRAAWGFLAIQAMVRNGPVPEVDESYEFRVADEVFSIVVRDGTASASRGAADEPAIVVRCDAETFIRIGAEMLSPFDAVVTGNLTIEGPSDAVQRCTNLMGLNASVGK